MYYDYRNTGAKILKINDVQHYFLFFTLDFTLI